MIFKSTKSKLKHYNIPPTDENHELLRKAKAAIAASHPDQALELLSSLKLKTLDIEITALSARLADLERTQRFGTESYDSETREHNKINKSIIFLLTALEKEIAQSFEFYDKIRAALKSRYENRLSQKLSNRQPVNLRLVPSTTGTTPQAANTFVQYSEGQIRGKLAEYYKDANGRLLLVGVPGAGKTTLLLQLELELLEKEISRIPVILNLARWSSEFPTLEAWIQEILPSEMGLTINKKVAADLIAQNRLILILDGLDEVKKENCRVCMEAIGEYGEDSSRCFIISSRIDDYTAIAKDAPVNSQVEVGTLNYEQLIEQLEKTDANEGSQRLLAALKEDKLLREIAEIPFYFNALQLLFARGKYLHEFNFSAQNIEGRKKELEQSFVSEMFRKINGQGYDTQLTTKYLGFFASRLKRANLFDFELIHLQYSWCRLSKWETKISKFFEALVGALVVAQVIAVIAVMIVAMIAALEKDFAVVMGIFLIIILGIVPGVILGVILVRVLGVGFITTLIAILITILVTTTFSILVLVLLISLFMGLFIGTVVGMGVGWSRDLPVIITRENIKWNWRIFIHSKNLIVGLVSGLGLGLIIVLVVVLLGFGENLVVSRVLGLSLIGGLIGSLVRMIVGQLENYNFFIQINTPYQRFSASAKILYFSILQHWHLSHIVHKKGLLPKKLVAFLNNMVKCNILETTGASWRFRHRILQDYFADQWVETEFEPEQK